LAELHSQQDPTFRTLLSYTRLTAAEALKQLLLSVINSTLLNYYFSNLLKKRIVC
jgi:hypothetical protein